MPQASSCSKQFAASAGEEDGRDVLQYIPNMRTSGCKPVWKEMIMITAGIVVCETPFVCRLREGLAESEVAGSNF